MDHVGQFVVGEDAHDVFLLVCEKKILSAKYKSLTVKLQQKLTCIAGPNPHCSLLSSSENIVSICIHSGDPSAMGISNFPDLPLALFHYKSAEEAVAPARHNRFSIIERIRNRDSLRSVVGVRCENALIIAEVPQFEGTVGVDADEFVTAAAKCHVLNCACVGVRVDQEAQILHDDSVDFSSNCASD